MKTRDDDKLIRMFVTKIEELQAERKRIDEQIAALSLSFEAVAGREFEAEGVEPIRRRGTRTRDPEAIPKTVAFLAEKGKATVSAIARNFGITKHSARARGMVLVKRGEATIDGVTFSPVRK